MVRTSRGGVGLAIPMALLLAALGACTTGPQAEPEAATPPNIVYILADDLGYGEVGVYGQEIIETPNIDALARGGLRFTDHYSGAPVCAPARGVILTGLHTGHAYIRGNDEMGDRGDVWDFAKMAEDPNLEGQRPLPAGTRTRRAPAPGCGVRDRLRGQVGPRRPPDRGHPQRAGLRLLLRLQLPAPGPHLLPGPPLEEPGEGPPSTTRWCAPNTPLDEGADPNDPAELRAVPAEGVRPGPDAGRGAPVHRAEPGSAVLPGLRVPHPPRAPAGAGEVGEALPGEAGPGGALHRGSPTSPTGRPAPPTRRWSPPSTSRWGGSWRSSTSSASGRTPSSSSPATTAPPTPAAPTAPSSTAPGRSAASSGRGKGSVYEGGIRVPMIASWPGHIAPGSTTDHVSAFWDVLPTLCEIGGAPGARRRRRPQLRPRPPRQDRRAGDARVPLLGVPVLRRPAGGPSREAGRGSAGTCSRGT